MCTSPATTTRGSGRRLVCGLIDLAVLGFVWVALVLDGPLDRAEGERSQAPSGLGLDVDLFGYLYRS